MKEVRVALLGTGVIARSHAESYKSIPGVKIVAACDILPKKLEAFCDRYGIENRYADYREMLKRDDIDAVDVCVHNNLHTPLATAVMRAGKDCYCEKPLSGAYVDALAIVKTAEETGRKLHVQVSSLYRPATHAAKRLIEDGQLGKLYHARSYGFRRRGRPFVDGYAEKEFNSKYWAAGGALYDMGVYHISELLYLLGLPKVERVTGKVYQEVPMHPGRQQESGFNVEELGCGFVHFEGGLTLDILESWAIHAGEFPPSIIAGSLGGVSLSGRKLEFFNEISGYPMNTVVDLDAEQYRSRQIDPSLDLYDGSQKHWIGVLRGQCPLLNTAEITLQTMLISEGIYRASEMGHDISAEQIVAESKSQAVTTQETPFGVLHYEW